MQGLLGRGLRHPREAWAQGGGHRGEAGCQDTHPLADHLDDARGKVAHTVGAPLALVDVALPAAVWVLLKHLWQTGRGAWSLPAPSGQPAAVVQLLPSPQGAPPDAQVGLQSCPCQHPAQPPGCLQGKQRVWSQPGFRPQLHCRLACDSGQITLILLSLNSVSPKKGSGKNAYLT